MRLPNPAHDSRPWRIHEIASDFTAEDVWALPVHGDAEDFQTLLEIMTSDDLMSSASLPARVLWRVRDRLGSWFGLGRISVPVGSGWDDAAGRLPIPGRNEKPFRCWVVYPALMRQIERAWNTRVPQ